jgi:hypothetical protein
MLVQHQRLSKEGRQMASEVSKTKIMDGPSNQDLIAKKYKQKLKLYKFLKALPFWVLIIGFIIIILGMTLSVLLNAYFFKFFISSLVNEYLLLSIVLYLLSISLISYLFP